MQADQYRPQNEPTLKQIWETIELPCKDCLILFHASKDQSQKTMALEGMLDFCYDSLVSNRHLNSDHSEDALTVQIVEQLKLLGIWATHDTQIGGHCDIVVQGSDRYLWIAEAKLHSDYERIRLGFLQLSTRYVTGGYGRGNGEIIIYCRTGNAAQVLRNWMSRACSTIDFQAKVVEEKIDPQLWFRTEHICPNSGTSFYTRHRIVPLHWAPKK